ncbi:MAG: hypothetical protein M1828_006637 [Chrysothrix sp. TS-e1954]|nr:MAG: hypothetical protein M1828_006637 [Chrysothrix sp. TS-e1954]
MDSPGYAFSDRTFLDADDNPWGNDGPHFNYGPLSQDDLDQMAANGRVDDEARAGDNKLAQNGSQMRSNTQSKAPQNATFPGLVQNSSASGSSSHSSSPDSLQRDKDAASSESPIASVLGDDTAMKGQSSTDPYKGSFPYDEQNMNDGDQPFGAGMDNLSLGTAGVRLAMAQGPSFSAAQDASNYAGGVVGDTDIYTASTISNFQQHAITEPPQMTIQPSSTWISSLDNHSPNQSTAFHGPTMSSQNQHAGSGSYNGFGIDSPESNRMVQDQSADVHSVGIRSQDVPLRPRNNADLQPISDPSRPPSRSRWPCQLSVDRTPGKSRVETQIPIILSLAGCPSGYTKLHIPSHTISKPKFQQKPPHEKSADTLELSTMLVCASALDKEGVRERVYHRAESDEVPVKKEDSPDKVQDENDPERPLNGAPVTICQGCITRERKRAARKKTKKVEEEEEWAKDEAKRVIVFNCQEVKDWCLPGSKETPIKDTSTTAQKMVIFTIKTPEGQILAQAESDSIMITDDHKQPMPGTPGYDMPQGSQFGPAGSYYPPSAYQMYPGYVQDSPMRQTYSTPDLRHFGQLFGAWNSMQYGVQPQYDSNTSTASATPRNLSRPPSPTDPGGQPGAKKRRSGGPNHHRVPSALHMTRLNTHGHASYARGPGLGGPTSAGLPSSNFSFTSPGSANFAPGFGQSINPAYTSQRSLQSGSITPYGLPSTFGSPETAEPDPAQYFSAPTSQRPSRAPSPSASTQRDLQSAQSHHGSQVPDRLADVVKLLPAHLDLQRPPTIQCVIPPAGERSGGQKVSILGFGFRQGLEVMFGDVPAVDTRFWSDSTIVCTVPSSSTNGAKPVLFRYQHHSAPADVKELQLLMPRLTVSFTYHDNDGLGGGGILSNTNIGLGSPMNDTTFEDTTLSSPNLDTGYA